METQPAKKPQGYVALLEVIKEPAFYPLQTVRPISICSSLCWSYTPQFIFYDKTITQYVIRAFLYSKDFTFIVFRTFYNSHRI